jgi:hypothetical protein
MAHAEHTDAIDGLDLSTQNTKLFRSRPTPKRMELLYNPLPHTQHTPNGGVVAWLSAWGKLHLVSNMMRFVGIRRAAQDGLPFGLRGDILSFGVFQEYH